MAHFFNRRNAGLGWVAWRLGRRAAARKLKRRGSSGPRLLRLLLIASTMSLGIGFAAALGGRREAHEAHADDWL